MAKLHSDPRLLIKELNRRKGKMGVYQSSLAGTAVPTRNPCRWFPPPARNAPAESRRRHENAWLEARASNPDGGIDQRALDALRRGWYLGEETFRDRLLDLVDKVKGVRARKRQTTACVARDYGTMEAEKMIETCGPHLGLPTDSEALATLRKGDERKALLATVLRSRTTVSFDWIAKRLSMGHPGSVSRQVGNVKRDRKLKKRTVELEQMLQCED